MKSALTLSIVIPVYNEENYLKACLEAIAKQNTKPLEVIVVDNNSTDGSTKIAKSYKFVKLVNESRQSVLFARNKGFGIAKGNIIGRIDADTVLPVHWVRRVLVDFEDKNLLAVTGPVSYYDMPLPWFNYWLDHWLRALLSQLAPDCPFLFGSNMAIRTETWETLKDSLCSDTQIHEDLDLAVHINKKFPGSILYDKKLHAGASSRRYEDSWRNFLHYGQMYRWSYKQHGIKSIAPRLVTIYYTAGYILLRPARAFYDPVNRHRSLSHALNNKREKARKNPMAH